jgi:uncharacterized SAM-binding protein YcdF (DUF218 family)
MSDRARRLCRAVFGLGLACGLYVLVTLVQVVVTSRAEQARQADAVVVLGAAQYNGVPSPVLRARLDHALDLWRRGVAPMVVVTGGKQPGDRVTEATASADYLIERGVPDAAILREVQGHTTWESLAAAARILTQRDLESVVLVSDPYHALRIRQTARELGLTAYVSPTRTSPEPAYTVARHVVQETVGVSVARFIGYRRLLHLDR